MVHAVKFSYVAEESLSHEAMSTAAGVHNESTSNVSVTLGRLPAVPLRDPLFIDDSEDVVYMNSILPLPGCPQVLCRDDHIFTDSGYLKYNYTRPDGTELPFKYRFIGLLHPVSYVSIILIINLSLST